MRTSNMMRSIPDNAALIFEFNNDKGFYDIFNDNKLFAAVIGKQAIGELDTLRTQLLLNPLFERYFSAQNIFVSVHPSKSKPVELLLTISAANGFETSMFEQITKQQGSGIVITPLRTTGKQGYSIYINALKKRFYVISKEDNIFSGSFSKELIDESAVYVNKADKKSFVLLSEQQNANSLANLYINYSELAPLFNVLLQNKNTDLFASLKQLPGLAALSLNYRSDALMFNGSTAILSSGSPGYLSLFAAQQPVVNHLKDIFPSTTAYSINFAVSSPLKFAADLEKQQSKNGLKNESGLLFTKIKAETGISLKSRFDGLLGSEFGIVTTRYFEKLAIVSIKDGSKLKALLTDMSKMTDENSGQLNYDKVPFFLLGEPFGAFKRPYFIIIDNYLILANSAGELTSYLDMYINRKFLSKNDKYNQFDDLLSAQSNAAFFFHFKNMLPIFKRDLYAKIYDIIENDEPGWKNFYAASLQFTAAESSLYTNFCMKLNADTVLVNK